MNDQQDIDLKSENGLTESFSKEGGGYKKFANRLMQLMRERAWSQADLSRATGFKKDRISTYVRGRNFPTKKAIGKLAAALGVDPTYLYPGYVAPEPTNVVKFEISEMTTDDWVKVTMNCKMPRSFARKIQQIYDEFVDDNPTH